MAQTRLDPISLGDRGSCRPTARGPRAWDPAEVREEGKQSIAHPHKIGVFRPQGGDLLTAGGERCGAPQPPRRPDCHGRGTRAQDPDHGGELNECGLIFLWHLGERLGLALLALIALFATVVLLAIIGGGSTAATCHWCEARGDHHQGHGDSANLELPGTTQRG
jgi:hypothetical protein